MSIKRSRATYEADLQAQQSPFVVYGKPLPPLDPDVRDDGSYVPPWKQEVTDEQGRKRLHGAFTGGFSAGYFNTVGSKEGWTPSTFVSSRGNRKQADEKTLQQRAEDLMDDEDLANEAETQRMQTADGFAGFGSTDSNFMRRGVIIDLFKTEGETMGVKLLKRMGWREGQGIGPKVRREAQLSDSRHLETHAEGERHLFAPKNTSMISFTKKSDHKGLGFSGDSRLVSDRTTETSTKSDDDDDREFGTASSLNSKKKNPVKRSGIGIGVLNDTGSDDEDPYEVGPRISYSRVLGGEKKKKLGVNGLARPVYMSKKMVMAKASSNFRKCHDGRLPLDGFVLGNDMSTSTSIITSEGKYPPPEIPKDWKSLKQPNFSSTTSNYLSTAEIAKSSNLDPKSRAALLGEKQLPGKSVFDYLSSAARDRLVSASGKKNLPPALGEMPDGYALTEEGRQKEILNQVPKLDKDIAIAALGKGTSGWIPYADDEAKRVRYLEFLEYQAGVKETLPQKAQAFKKDSWLKELQEFVQCAQIFKPMTGLMATRFTSSSSAQKATLESPTTAGSASLLSKPAPKAEDPAEAAAKMGMFGPMTRSSEDFYPSRLLCKRFNVKPPAHVQLDPDHNPDNAGTGRSTSEFQSSDGKSARNLDLVSKSAIDDMLRESGGKNQHWKSTDNGADTEFLQPPEEDVVDPEKNEALEGEKAGEAVFKAIFGDDEDD